MELEHAKSWLAFMSLLISVGSAIWVFVTSGAKKTATELADYKKAEAEEKKKLMEAITELGKRTQALESDVKHLPTAKDVMEMNRAISDLSGKIGRMEESQNGMARTVNRVEDFLLRGNAAA